MLTTSSTRSVPGKRLRRTACAEGSFSHIMMVLTPTRSNPTSNPPMPLKRLTATDSDIFIPHARPCSTAKVGPRVKSTSRRSQKYTHYQSRRDRSEEHTSELQPLSRTSSALLSLKNKKK